MAKSKNEMVEMDILGDIDGLDVVDNHGPSGEEFLLEIESEDNQPEVKVDLFAQNSPECVDSADVGVAPPKNLIFA